MQLGVIGIEYQVSFLMQNGIINFNSRDFNLIFTRYPPLEYLTRG